MSEPKPLIVHPETYEQVLKDPLYGPLARIGVEIERIIVRSEKGCRKSNV